MTQSLNVDAVSGEVWPRPMQSHSKHLVMERFAVHARFYGNEGSTSRRRCSCHNTWKKSVRSLLYGRRFRNNHVNIHAGRPVSCTANAPDNQLQSYKLHEYVFHLQKHTCMHAADVSPCRHSGIIIQHPSLYQYYAWLTATKLCPQNSESLEIISINM